MNQPSEKTTAVLDKIIIFSLFTFVAFSMFSISITQISAGVGGVAWLLRTHFTSSWHEQRWPLVIPFLLFMLACLVAVVNAYDIDYSYKSLKKLLEILIFFWAVNCIRESHLRDSLIILLIISATLAGLFGFYQAWGSGDLTGLANRVEGTMSVYMTFAGLLMMVGVLTLSRLLFRRPLEPWFFASLGVLAICLLLTLTRQAWFGFLVGGLFLFSIWRKKILLIFATLLLGVIIFSSEYVRSKILMPMIPDAGPIFEATVGKSSFIDHLQFRVFRIFDGKDETFLIRLALWQGGWEVLKDYPFTGCGFRCMDLIHTQYPDPTGFIKAYRGMHNNFIQLAVDTGIFGLASWISIWVCFFFSLFKKVTSNEGDLSRQWVSLGSMAAVIAFLLGGFFETNFYDAEVAALLFFIMSLPFTVGANGDGLTNHQT